MTAWHAPRHGNLVLCVVLHCALCIARSYVILRAVWFAETNDVAMKSASNTHAIGCNDSAAAGAAVHTSRTEVHIMWGERHCTIALTPDKTMFNVLWEAMTRFDARERRMDVCVRSHGELQRISTDSEFKGQLAQGVLQFVLRDVSATAC